MSWNKPKNIGYWLLLVSPGALSLVCTACGYFLIPNKDSSGPDILGVLAVLPMCAVAAYFLVRRTGTAGNVFAFWVLFTVILLFVNLSIAIGGCAAMPPKMDFR